ncbi:MAG: hypothetical protein D6813_03185, partial [Calditrichaeota bacterium]
FDANAFIGRHENPFVPSPFDARAAEALCHSGNGLHEMLVYHSAAVLYDADYGNELLIKETLNKKSLWTVWVALPEHAENDEIATAFFMELEKNKVAAIKIFPRKHNYLLKNRCLDPLLSLFNENRKPLLADQQEITWDEIEYVLRQFPEIPLVLTGVNYRLGRYVEPLLKHYSSFHLEISRYQVHRGLEYLCQRFGSERLLFGSGLPLFSSEPVMMMVASAQISEHDKKNIAGENLRRLLSARY